MDGGVGEDVRAWTPIGQTSNQLIVYHPPSHALSVVPHPRGSFNAVSGPSRPQRPLLLPYRADSPTPTIGGEGICPLCRQTMPTSPRPAARSFGSFGSGSGNRGRRQSLPYNTPPHPVANGLVGRSYFQVLEQAHEGAAPAAAGRMRDYSEMSPTPEPSDPAFGSRDWDDGNGSAIVDDEAEDTDNPPARGYYERFFREERRLGMGAEGSVYLATHVIEGNELGTYAVKKIAVGTSKQYLLKMLREVKLHETLRHPNIIPYHHSWIDITRFSNFGPPITALHVLMMYATAGNLDTFLLTRSHAIAPERQDLSAGDIADNESIGNLPKEERIKAFRRRRLSSIARQHGLDDSGGHKERSRKKQQETRGVLMLGLEEVLKLFGDVVEGLAFLHANSILHLDLKCSNVLLHWEDGALTPRALISDFGTSEEMLRGKRNRTGHTGTMEYMAPETIVPDARGNWRPSDSHADMWSLGMILHKLLFLRLPYGDTEDFDALQQAIREYPGFVPSPELIFTCERRHIPRDMLVLLSKLVHTNPDVRPSAEKVKLGLSKLQRYLDRSSWSASSAGSLIKRLVFPLTGTTSTVPAATRTDPLSRPVSPVQSLLALPGPGDITASLVPAATLTSTSPARAPATAKLIGGIRPVVFVLKMLSIQPQLGGPDMPVSIVLVLVCLAMVDLRSQRWSITAGLGCLHSAVILGYVLKQM